MGLLLVIILLALLLGSAPVYPHSRRWGYGPSGIFGLLVVVVIVLLLMNTIPFMGWNFGPPSPVVVP